MISNKKLLLWLAIPLTAMASSLAGGVPAPGDFADGIPVTPAGDAAAQFFEVPYTVYAGVTRRDRGDVAVFDANGRLVPWMIRQARIFSREETVYELPMFPMHAGSGKDPEDLSLKIEHKADGTLVDIQTAGAAPRTELPKRIAYLFDLRPVEESVDGRVGELVFAWDNATTDTIWRVTIEGSDDLQNWETLAFDAVLTGLDYGGHTLIKNSISILPVGDIKYLRMRWPEDQEAPELSKVTVKFQSHQTRAEWRSRSFKLAPVEAAAGYTFSTGGFVPVEKFLFELPAGNSLYKGKLYSRVDDKHDWTLRGEFLQYRLRSQNTVLASDEQTVRITTDPQWLVTFEEPRVNGNVQLPDVRIAWKAEYLHFLALGEAPYTLAYGNASGNITEYPSDTLRKLSVQDEPGEAAKLGAPFVLGGDQKRLLPAEPLPWRIIMLWIALLAGVALMARMALNLYRQMNET